MNDFEKETLARKAVAARRLEHSISDQQQSRGPSIRLECLDHSVGLRAEDTIHLDLSAGFHGSQASGKSGEIRHLHQRLHQEDVIDVVWCIRADRKTQVVNR